MSMRNALVTCVMVGLAVAGLGRFTDAEYEVVKLSEQVDDLCNRPSLAVASAGGYALKVYPLGKYVTQECVEARTRTTIASMTGMPVWAITTPTGDLR